MHVRNLLLNMDQLFTKIPDHVIYFYKQKQSIHKSMETDTFRPGCSLPKPAPPSSFEIVGQHPPSQKEVSRKRKRDREEDVSNLDRSLAAGKAGKRRRVVRERREENGYRQQQWGGALPIQNYTCSPPHTQWGGTVAEQQVANQCADDLPRPTVNEWLNCLPTTEMLEEKLSMFSEGNGGNGSLIIIDDWVSDLNKVGKKINKQEPLM